MTPLISRAMRLTAITALASTLPPSLVWAQAAGEPPTPSSLLSVKATVPTGGIVEVTDLQGKTVTGGLGSVAGELVEIDVEGETRAVVARNVRRIRWRQQDSWLTGALVGAGIGAIPGISYLITDPNECVGLCPEEYGLVGLGALAGALVDKAITKKVTVYEAPAKGGADGNWTLTPVLTGVRRGVQVAVRF